MDPLSTTEHAPTPEQLAAAFDPRVTVLRVEIDNDPFTTCPADRDSAWTIYTFSSSVPHYAHPTHLGIGLQLGPDGTPAKVLAKLRRKLNNGLAFWLSCYRHGNSIWFRKGSNPQLADSPDGRWDCAPLAGLLVWDHRAPELGPKDMEGRAADADAFLAEYTAWINGEGWCHRILDAHNEVLESCGDFFDLDYMLSQIAEYLCDEDYIVDEQFERDLARHVRMVRERDRELYGDRDAD